MNRYQRNRNGFTLIELTIAAMILILVLCGVVVSLISFTSMVNTARDKTVAVNDAKQAMEQIWSTSFSSITTTIDNTNWTTWVANNGGGGLDNELVNVTYDDSVANLLKFTVTVNWQTGSKSMSISLVGSRTPGY